MDELNKYSKSNPFKVPENYFEDFDHKLMQEIDLKKNKNIGMGKIQSIKPYLAIAAGFLLLFSMWFMFLNKFGSDKIASNDEILEKDALFAYFESVDTDELIQILSAENFTEKDFAINLETDIDMIIDDLDESTIIEEIEDLNTIDEI